MACRIGMRSQDRTRFQMVAWTQDVEADFISKRTDLHFNRLLPFKKTLVCNALAKKDAKCFVVMSNKKNIEKYKNNKLDDGNKAWIYWWRARLLQERVSRVMSMIVFNAPSGAARSVWLSSSIIFSPRWSH